LNILVFGATGPTGQQIVRQALNRSHRVVAFVRQRDGLPIKDDHLTLVVGDTTQDESQVAEAMRGQEVVVSALGRRNSFRSDHLISRSMRTILPAMVRAGVRRLILVSALGVGDSHRGAPLIPRIMYRVLLRDIFADKNTAEEDVRSSGLEWTIVYPVLLTNGPLTGRYRVGEQLALHGLPKISRADLAHFILSEVESPAFVRKVAAISY
jgi:putative NADH-flavin reductase